MLFSKSLINHFNLLDKPQALFNWFAENTHTLIGVNYDEEDIISAFAWIT